jgi:lipopolysaccharide/colanic/teichoic acid biosynthesis glycosyltransferase
MTSGQRLLKRTLDLVGAAVGLVLLAPLILVLMVVVRRSSPGPAIYRQVRIGRYGKPFALLKLRSMRFAAGNEGSTITLAGDERITGVGAFLRRYKLDELPQLWNVLKGDMSFVGPRPDVPGYADQLRGDDRRILDVRPGITGPATLYYRAEEEILAAADDPVAENDLVLYPMKTKLNLEYLDRWSFGRDLGYILVTVLPLLDRWLHLVPGPPFG